MHYHRIELQLIYCCAGWVRVVYEDQGEPFVMRAGDCVLQPPEIRHRVLECSDGLEVVELSVPAEHPTFADRKLELPTPVSRPDRSFGGQRFVLHRAADAPWEATSAAGLESRDLGLGPATAGLASATVVRATESGSTMAVEPEEGMALLFVLDGDAHLSGYDLPSGPLGRAGAASIPADAAVAVRFERAAELLVVSVRCRTPQ